MEDTNGPVFTTGYAPAARHSYADNDGTAQYDARRFIRPTRTRRPRLFAPLAWYAAGVVTGGGLAAVVMAGAATLNGCSW